MKGTKGSQDGINPKPHEKKYRKIRYQEEERGEREMWSIRGRGRGEEDVEDGEGQYKKKKKKGRKDKRERKQKLRMTLDKKHRGIKEAKRDRMVLERWCVVVEVVDQRVGVRWISSDTASERERGSKRAKLGRRERERASFSTGCRSASI